MVIRDEIYKIALLKLKGIGSVNAKLLLSYCGSAQKVFEATKKELVAIPQIGEITAQSVLASKEEALETATAELEFIERENIQIISYYDAEYPNRLKYCEDSPVTLFYKGNANLNAEKFLTIVGTRNITNYGKQIVKDVLYQLRGIDVTIVSGLAYGVDTEVHKACLEHNLPTIGVLAHGLDKIYPSQNRKLANQMLEHGGLLTEFTTNTRPDRENFPKRNRIVAGISDATIVVESGESGGSLITADIAFSYNRDVMAFPGNVDQEYSKGCHRLIKSNQASLIENADDILRLLGWQIDEKVNQNRQKQLFLNLNEVEQQIVKLLLNNPLSAELISVKSSLPLSLVRTHLLNLELNGVVRISPGNEYTLN